MFVLSSVLLLLLVAVQFASANIVVDAKFSCTNNWNSVWASAIGDSNWWNEPSGRSVLNETQLNMYHNGSFYVVAQDSEQKSGSNNSIWNEAGHQPWQATAYASVTVFNIYINGSFSGSVTDDVLSGCGSSPTASIFKPTL